MDTLHIYIYKFKPYFVMICNAICQLLQDVAATSQDSTELAVKHEAHNTLKMTALHPGIRIA
jgi:hypothetical protein